MVAKSETADLSVTPKTGDVDTVFDFRGSGYEGSKVLIIDFGDGASTSIPVSDDGHWHVNYRYGTEGSHEATTKYSGDDEDIIDTVTVRVSK